MRQSSLNPKSNVLPPSVSESALVDAVETSGYPLQGIVAEKLKRAGFGAVEEWGFIDTETQQQRSLDVLGYRSLGDVNSAAVEPRLEVLIECKRTVHPYVFFKKVAEISPPNFPVISAVHTSVEDSFGRSKSDIPGQLLLNLGQLPFITDPPRCASFSKATLSGKKVELSGDEPFNHIVLPLIKALEFKIAIDKVLARNEPQTPTLVLCIAVLHAPMLLVESPSKAGDPILTPWARVFRLQAKHDKSRGSHEFYGIDFVHIDAFEEFFNVHLEPFTTEFARRAVALRGTWKAGGVVSDISNIDWTAIKPKS